MAGTLSGSPPAFDKNDVAGTVKALCAYTRALQENLDFALGQMQKGIQTAQESVEAAAKAVNAAAAGCARLEARVAALEQTNT